MHGNEGSLYVARWAGEKLQLFKGDSTTTYQLPDVPGVLPKELADLAENIRAGRPVEVDGESGLRNLAAIWASLKSAKERRPVTMAEMLESC